MAQPHPRASSPRDALENQRILHSSLARWNRARLSPATPPSDWRNLLALENRMRDGEHAFILDSRRKVAARAEAAPEDPDAFVLWFEALKEHGPGQGDPLFPWLADSATLEDMRWFIEQEAAGEAGFDDLLAMTLVRMPTRVKLEFARNFADEMGRGNVKGMHGPMLDALVLALGVTPTIERTLTGPLELGNTMVALATNRAYAFHSVGALGVIELTAPDRALHVAAGLKRLGVSIEARRYFDLHATLDVRHSQAWNREVIWPLVSAQPNCARAIAEGALMRLECGLACFEAYRAHLWRPDHVRQPEQA